VCVCVFVSRARSRFRSSSSVFFNTERVCVPRIDGTPFGPSRHPRPTWTTRTRYGRCSAGARVSPAREYTRSEPARCDRSSLRAKRVTPVVVAGFLVFVERAVAHNRYETGSPNALIPPTVAGFRRRQTPGKAGFGASAAATPDCGLNRIILLLGYGRVR